jgi:hypothetical protein
LTVNSVRAGDAGDDDALPCLPSFAYLCGSPIRKLIQNLTRNVHVDVEIYKKEMGRNDGLILSDHYARMIVTVAATHL